MAEEKKEEQAQDQEAPKPHDQEAPKPVEAPQPAAAAPVKEEKAAPVKAEKPVNCAACKKSIRKKRWYYRDGNYYCTKRCWSTATKKPAKTEEAPAAS